MPYVITLFENNLNNNLDNIIQQPIEINNNINTNNQYMDSEHNPSWNTYQIDNEEDNNKWFALHLAQLQYKKNKALAYIVCSVIINFGFFICKFLGSEQLSCDYIDILSIGLLFIILTACLKTIIALDKNMQQTQRLHRLLQQDLKQLQQHSLQIEGQQQLQQQDLLLIINNNVDSNN